MPHDDPLAGKVITGDWAVQLDTQGTYTPELTATTTNPNLGTDSTQEGAWHRNGHLINVSIKITFGTGSSAGSGSYRLSVPFDIDASLYGGLNVLGAGYLIDIGTATNRQPVVAVFNNATELRLNGNGFAQVTNATPFSWADLDHIYANVSYLADPAGLP